ncbi:PilW family protein [Arenimonas sp.]|uniref:PilW family protein n=1 Tax=Arenimonas sp. TaxID=1872635 RepID=UPI0039E6B937
MKRAHPRLRTNLGVSLVELMISMVLGLIVAGAAVAMFATNRVTYSASENMGRIQEAGRAAFELMARDVREAGGNPCDANLPLSNGLNSPTGNWWKNWNNGLIGYAGTTAFPDVAFGTTAGARVSGTEAIEVKYGELPSTVNTTANLSDANLNQPIPVRTVTGLTTNDLLIACDYRGATVFQATSFVGNTILHASGAGTGGSPGNASATLLLGPHGNDKDGVAMPGLAINGMVSKLKASRWYIGCNGRADCAEPVGRSLYQSSLVNNAGTFSVVNDEIANGVSNMTMRYLASGGTNYTTSAGVTNWGAVGAIKVTLTISAPDRGGSTDSNAAISRTVQHVISLRNNLL